MMSLTKHCVFIPLAHFCDVLSTVSSTTPHVRREGGGGGGGGGGVGGRGRDKREKGDE